MTTNRRILCGVYATIADSADAHSCIQEGPWAAAGTDVDQAVVIVDRLVRVVHGQNEVTDRPGGR